jgi:hypothetical protein
MKKIVKFHVKIQVETVVLFLKSMLDLQRKNLKVLKFPKNIKRYLIHSLLTL